MLHVDSQAPDADIETHLGYRGPLSGLWQDGPLVLFFYPMDDTPTCAKQACAMQSELAAFGQLDANVLGANNGSSESHRRFAEKHGLEFPIVVDEGGDLAKRYEAFRRLLRIPKRITYVISSQGRIVGAVHKEFDVSGHLEGVRQALAGLGGKPN